MAFAASYSYPSSSFGSWRGGGGTTGLPGQGAKEMGQATQGQGLMPAGIGSVSVGGQDWHPTILYLLGLLIVEMIVFGVIGRILK